MLNLSLYSLFVITSIMTVATPGPGVLMTLMKSIGYGFRGAIWTICGTATGAIIMSAISATGVGLILRASPDAYALCAWWGRPTCSGSASRTGACAR